MPEALRTLLFGGRSVVVASVGVDFGNAEREEGEGEEFEGFDSCITRVDGRKQSVFLGGFGVLFGLERAESTLYWGLLDARHESKAEDILRNMSFR